MSGTLKINVKTLFGLAFDIEKDESRKSGFKPASIDLGIGKELFGDLRLDGFAAALTTGFADELVLAGGDEGRYKGETPVINRAWAIREMLIHDYGIDARRVKSFASKSNTLGNVGIIREFIRENGRSLEECGLMTNLYHLPRAHMDIVAHDVPLQLFAAESLYLIEQPDRKNDLVRRLGEGPMAERMAEEIAGIADKIRGSYQSKTDAAPVSIPGAVRSNA
jgi:hypothetical protein